MDRKSRNVADVLTKHKPFNAMIYLLSKHQLEVEALQWVQTDPTPLSQNIFEKPERANAPPLALTPALASRKPMRQIYEESIFDVPKIKDCENQG